jgi:hypothetical protein
MNSFKALRLRKKDVQGGGENSEGDRLRAEVFADLENFTVGLDHGRSFELDLELIRPPEADFWPGEVMSFPGQGINPQKTPERAGSDEAEVELAVVGFSRRGDAQSRSP